MSREKNTRDCEEWNPLDSGRRLRKSGLEDFYNQNYFYNYIINYLSVIENLIDSK